MMCSPSGHLHPQSSPKPGRGERGEGSKKGLDCLGRRLAVEGTPPTTLAPPSSIFASLCPERSEAAFYIRFEIAASP